MPQILTQAVFDRERPAVGCASWKVHFITDSLSESSDLKPVIQMLKKVPRPSMDWGNRFTEPGLYHSIKNKL